MPTYSLYNAPAAKAAKSTYSLAPRAQSTQATTTPSLSTTSPDGGLLSGPGGALIGKAAGMLSGVVGGNEGGAIGNIGSGALNIVRAATTDQPIGQSVAQGIQGGIQGYQGVSQLTNGAIPAIPGGPWLQAALSALGAGASGGAGGLLAALPNIGIGLMGGIGAANLASNATAATTAAASSLSAAEAAALTEGAGTMTSLTPGAAAGAGGAVMLMAPAIENIAGSIQRAFQDVPHSVREAQGTQRANALGQTMLQEMNLATTPQELWEAIQRYQMNTDPGIQLQGVDSLEGLLANPQAARLSTQAGVSPGGIAQANDQLTKMLQANATVIAAARAGNPDAIRFLEQRLQARPEFIRQAGEMVMPTPSHVIPPGGRGDAVDAGPRYDPARPSSIAEIMSPLIAGGVSLPQIQALISAGNAVPMIPFGGMGDAVTTYGFSRSDPLSQEYLIDPQRGGGG